MKKKSFAHVLLRKSVEKSFCFGRAGPTVEAIIGGRLSLNPLFVPSKLAIAIGCEPEPAKYDRRMSRWEARTAALRDVWLMAELSFVTCGLASMVGGSREIEGPAGRGGGEGKKKSWSVGQKTPGLWLGGGRRRW